MPLSRTEAQARRDRIREVLAEACARLGAAEASLWVLGPEGDEVQLAINAGGDAALLETLAVPVVGSVVGLVFATGMSTAIGPGEDHHPGIDVATGIATRAMGVAPVRTDEGVEAVISAINPAGRTRFIGADLETLGNLAQRLVPLCVEGGHALD